MNLQIVSDSVNRTGTTNYTNSFTMSLNEVIDAENENVYLKVLNVSYPLTVKNVLSDDCWFTLKITSFNFKPGGSPCEVTFEVEKTYLPDGIYTLDKLISALNSFLEEYDIVINRTREGKVGVNFNFNSYYWFQRNGGLQGGDRVSQLQVECNFSEKLQYMLGMDRGVEYSETYETFWGKELPDIMDGVNKIFVYCDEVEASIVGDSKSRLLAIVPIKLEGQGSGENFTFFSAETRRKLIKSKITEIHISLCDSSNRLIPFASGTVNIECALEKE